MEFRLLKADEIDCRISTVNQNGLSLLLYKDARCDQNILDETVGAMNWQRHHSRENANCIVSIWDENKKQWVEKEDTGTDSYTEKEKGRASDSFKRACFNWGIGRELYTAPFMWVKKDDCNIEPYFDKYTCKDRFRVVAIEYTADRKISYVEIQNMKNHKTIVFGKPAGSTKRASDVSIDVLKQLCEKYSINLEAWLEKCGTTLDRLTVEQAGQMLQTIKTKYAG